MTHSLVFRLVSLACALGVACGEPVDLGGAAPPEEAGTDATSCPNLAPPNTKASCKGCSAGSSGCQANGCFNGYLCDITGEPDCKAPGTTCSSSTKLDAR